jgi:hypothetical protein
MVENLRIWNLRTGSTKKFADLLILWISQKKFADVQFADSRTSEICGFAIVGLAQ